tara:strand:+ start:372 stop:995 length:624 start_codon:yes stop_codon:yes gene_type:complete
MAKVQKRYFLDTGKDNIMWCLYFVDELWGTQAGYTGVIGEKTIYCRNLSTDYDVAVAKAKEWLKDSPYPLYANSDKKTNDWGTGSGNFYESINEEKRLERNRINKIQNAISQTINESWDTIREEVPNGKDTFTGKVLGIKFVDNDWGGTVKMVFQDDRGFKLYGNYGVRMEKATDSNDRLTFTAIAKQSNKDKYFGFFREGKPVKKK